MKKAGQSLAEPAQEVSVLLPSPKELLVWLICSTLLICAVSVIGRMFDVHILVKLFTFQGEATVPSWFTSIELALVACLLALAAVLQSRSRERAQARFLGAASAAFAFFSIDEVAAIHEAITHFLSRFAAIPAFSGRNGIWILVYLALATVLAGVFWRGVARFFRQNAGDGARFAAGFAVWALGGVGLEVLMYERVLTGPVQNLYEEGLEMIGAAVMAWAALRFLSSRRVSLRFAAEEPEYLPDPAVATSSPAQTVKPA